MSYGTVNDISVRHPEQRGLQVAGLVLAEDVHGEGLHGPDHLGGAAWPCTDQIAATGAKPWCIGIKSGEATGWQITDWLEEYVLRYAGPEVYDQWITHDVKFADPPIAEALAEVGALLKNPKYVNGGFGDVADHRFDRVQGCQDRRSSDGRLHLHPAGRRLRRRTTRTRHVRSRWRRQCLLLPADHRRTSASRCWAAARSPPPSRIVPRSRRSSTSWPARNSRTRAPSSARSSSPTTACRPTTSPSVIQKDGTEGLLQDPETVFRFDASDLMPAPVGSDAEWKQFTAWITGQDDATTLANIDAAWPAN